MRLEIRANVSRASSGKEKVWNKENSSYQEKEVNGHYDWKWYNEKIASQTWNLV